MAALHLQSTTMSKFYLNWDLLLEDKCPSCGRSWNQVNDTWICPSNEDHQKDFKIGAFKVAKIKHNLTQREELKPILEE